MSPVKHLKSKIVFLLIIVSLLLLGLTDLPWVISRPLLVTEDIQDAPLIVVLYCGYGDMIQNGLGEYSRQRVQKGVQLWKQGLASYILFTGGRADKRVFDLAGSERMSLEAIRLGVPKNKIIIENDSKDTRQNVLNATSILKEKNWDRLILVTNDFHMKRVMFLFNRNGLKVFPAPVEWQVKGKWTSNWTYLRFLFYEFRAWLAYSLLNDQQIDTVMDFLRPE